MFIICVFHGINLHHRVIFLTLILKRRTRFTTGRLIHLNFQSNSCISRRTSCFPSFTLLFITSSAHIFSLGFSWNLSCSFLCWQHMFVFPSTRVQIFSYQTHGHKPSHPETLIPSNFSLFSIRKDLGST